MLQKQSKEKRLGATTRNQTLPQHRCTHYTDGNRCTSKIVPLAKFCLKRIQTSDIPYYTTVHIRPRLHGTGSTWSRYQIDSFKTSVALKSMIILQNFITTNHRKSGKSKDDLKLTELDVVTMRIRYRVNGV